LNVPTLIVSADSAGDARRVDYRRAAANLAEAALSAADFGVRIGLEFQQSSGFCTSLDTALALLCEAGSPNVGICLDLFHFYTGPSKFEDLFHLNRDQLAWVQICDLSGTPRELATDGDRILPGEGDFQIEPILDRVQELGYTGHVCLEVLNPRLWQAPADRVSDLGFQAVCRALRKPRGRQRADQGGS
jgi:sugar phosphate isomerase/epimerase